ncbi:MAG TPA: hypothetical protein VGL22_04545 [Terracidiphilus sp.]
MNATALTDFGAGAAASCVSFNATGSAGPDARGIAQEGTTTDFRTNWQQTMAQLEPESQRALRPPTSAEAPVEQRSKADRTDPDESSQGVQLMRRLAGSSAHANAMNTPTGTLKIACVGKSSADTHRPHWTAASSVQTPKAPASDSQSSPLVATAITPAPLDPQNKQSDLSIQPSTFTQQARDAAGCGLDQAPSGLTQAASANPDEMASSPSRGHVHRNEEAGTTATRTSSHSSHPDRSTPALEPVPTNAPSSADVLSARSRSAASIDQPLTSPRPLNAASLGSSLAEGKKEQSAAAELSPQVAHVAADPAGQAVSSRMPATQEQDNLKDSSRSSFNSSSASASPHTSKTGAAPQSSVPASHPALATHAVAPTNSQLPVFESPQIQFNSAADSRGRAEMPAQTPAPDTFAALDSPGTMPPTTWLHGGPRHAEAGYFDPSLGWVGVRAETAGAAVHAYVVTASAEAARTLDTQLAGLNSFVAEQHGQSSTISLAAPELQQFSGPSHSGQGSAQQQGDDRQNHAPAAAPLPPGITPTQASSEVQTPYTRSGSHISVVA